MKHHLRHGFAGNKPLIIAAALLSLSACQQAVEEPALSGYIEAELRLIAAPQSGWITRLDWQEGQSVETGALLFELDQTEQRALTAQARENQLAAEAEWQDLQKGARQPELDALGAQLTQALARADLADRELQRLTSLVAKGLATEEQLDQARTEQQISQAQVLNVQKNLEVAGLSGRLDQLQAAAARIRSAAAQFEVQQHRLNERSVHSHNAGLIDEVYYHSGEFVTAGNPVLAIRLSGQDLVRFYVPQADLPGLSLGQRIQVKADGLPEATTATISHISSRAEFTPPVIYSQDSRSKLVFLIEARLDAGHPLPAGLPVDVRL